MMTTGVAACAVLALIGGCDKMPWNQSKGDESGDACSEYAKKVCDKAGAQSQTCSSTKATTELMPPDACKAALANVDYTLEKLGEARKKCDTLENKLCKALGKETETCKMVREQTKQFPPERCEMMLSHYDDVLKDLKQREAMNKPLPKEKVAELTAGNPPSFGPEDAKVTIVEFSDFQCPYCGRAAQVVEKLRKEYGDKVHFVFRQYPLPMHPNARPAAEAALAAHAQGKFWAFHDKLFADQRALSREAYDKYAKEVGLDVKQFDQAIESKKFADAIQSDMKLGQEVNVRGTPTMFINGERVPNPTSYEVVKGLIDKKLNG